MQQTITFRQKFAAVAQIFRPELPLAAGICVLIGELLALGAVPPLRVMGLGLVCGFFLSGLALVTNDYFDIEVDRINAPQRPLPAGILKPSTVMAMGLLAGLIGFAAAWALNPAALVLSVIMWVLGFLYNWKLKAAGLWGNLIVGTSVAATFILGGMAVGQVWQLGVWVFGLIAFFFDLAEEIAGDAMDAEGDQQRGSKSLGIQLGRQSALRVSGALIGVVLLLTVVLMVWGGAGFRYRVILPLMDVAIITFTVKLVRSETDAQGRRAMRWLYLSASAGLLVFLIATLLA